MKRNIVINALVNFWRQCGDEEYTVYIRQYAAGKSLHWAGDELGAAGVGNYIDNEEEEREIVRTAAIQYLNR